MRVLNICGFIEKLPIKDQYIFLPLTTKLGCSNINVIRQSFFPLLIELNVTKVPNKYKHKQMNEKMRKTLCDIILKMTEALPVSMPEF